MGGKIIGVRSLSHRYPDGTQSLRDVSLAVSLGEAVGIVGPNGAGKSTLLLHLNGVLDGALPSTGQIIVDGLQLTKKNLQEIRRRVGLVFQNPDDQLFTPCVFDDVAFGPLNLGLNSSEVGNRVEESLRAVGMTGAEARSPHHLSHGEKKRVAIATVLAMRPSILIMDEPSANLDPRSRRELISLLKGFAITKLVASHDLGLVSEVCQRVILMDAGQLVADGATREILSDRELLLAHGLEPL